MDINAFVKNGCFTDLVKQPFFVKPANAPARRITFVPSVFNPSCNRSYKNGQQLPDQSSLARRRYSPGVILLNLLKKAWKYDSEL